MENVNKILVRFESIRLRHEDVIYNLANICSVYCEWDLLESGIIVFKSLNDYNPRLDGIPALLHVSATALPGRDQPQFIVTCDTRHQMDIV